MKLNNELLKTLTVLYVEDDLLLKETLGRVLKRRFATVYEAKDGNEGFEIYRAHKDDIDIVITDVEMTGMSGLALIDKILEINEFQQIIITTGYNDKHHMSDKVCQNIKKPIHIDQLLESILFCVGKTGGNSN
ncbi:MAG: response regulator [Nitrospirae bacterium]|nr:response regulator [Nitrospirota bacterium]